MTASNIDARKLQLIERLTKLEDEELISLIEQLLQPDAAGDWAADLSENEKLLAEQGLADLEAGKTEPFEAFQKRMKAQFQ